MEPLARSQLFELAELPIGNRELQREADRVYQAGEEPKGELKDTSKRTSKIWTPHGKRSANTNEARDAERELKARNFDLEDAVGAAGGQRGSARV